MFLDFFLTWQGAQKSCRELLLELLASVREAVLEVNNTASMVSINRSRHPATKTRDQQRDRVYQLAERVGREFVGLEPDRAGLLL